MSARLFSDSLSSTSLNRLLSPPPCSTLSFSSSSSHKPSSSSVYSSSATPTWGLYQTVPSWRNKRLEWQVCAPYITLTGFVIFVYTRLTPAALARELQTKISSVTPDDIFDPDTLSSLEEHLSQMALMKRLPAPILSEVDEAGTALWNTCSQAMGNFAKIEVNLKILVRGVFIFSRRDVIRT